MWLFWNQRGGLMSPFAVFPASVHGDRRPTHTGSGLARARGCAKHFEHDSAQGFQGAGHAKIR